MESERTGDAGRAASQRDGGERLPEADGRGHRQRGDDGRRLLHLEHQGAGARTGGVEGEQADGERAGRLRGSADQPTRAANQAGRQILGFEEGGVARGGQLQLEGLAEGGGRGVGTGQLGLVAGRLDRPIEAQIVDGQTMVGAVMIEIVPAEGDPSPGGEEKVQTGGDRHAVGRIVAVEQTGRGVVDRRGEIERWQEIPGRITARREVGRGGADLI